MHLGIALSLNIYPFGLGMLICYVLLVPFKWWRVIGNLVTAKQYSLTVFYDKQCPLCSRTILILNHFDIFNCIDFKNAQNHAPNYSALSAIRPEALLLDLYALDSSNRIYSGVNTYIQILKKMRYLYPLGIILSLPGIHTLAINKYRSIADSRARISCDSECLISPTMENNTLYHKIFETFAASKPKAFSRKLTKIFIDKLVNMGLADREGEGKFSLYYDDGLDESKLNEGSDTYPFQADSETIALYDRIANELEGTISMVASKLEIPKSDIRISLDYLYDDLEDNKSKKKGMFIQVKADDAKWDKAWTGNPLIMQTTNDEGVVIPSNPFFGVSIKGNKNPKVRAIYNKALDLDLETLAASENAKIADLVSPEEMKLIAPNTPIVVTGK